MTHHERALWTGGFAVLGVALVTQPTLNVVHAAMYYAATALFLLAIVEGMPPSDGEGGAAA